MSYVDALTKEAAYLQTLLVANGGPFDVVQAYFPRTPSTSKKCLYVLRTPGQSGMIERESQAYQMNRTNISLRIMWPFTQGAGQSESDQAALDAAVQQVLVAVEGPLQDKSHGGRFLSVAENPSIISISVDDVEQSVTPGVFRVTISYWADDVPTVG